ncbi:hypothetical protein [Sphingomonas colocasiae]|uniref:DUF2178 domain-containing protein n=1 Tax=Sphingomonas colocasiae TaxID=1848973 RepID=A0ABS7PYI3_9SPHN|nr:hypothetical protein [Sphingomonas colocasiae]MBY8825029.1 hypothetical protein [Sphingomonas colocasiae]
MKRDWIWAWPGGLAGLAIALLAMGRLGLRPESYGLTTTLLFGIVMAAATGAVWLKNRHSISAIRRAGGEIELVIRPVDAVLKALFRFPTAVGVFVLWFLLIDGRIDDWGKILLLSACASYYHALTYTAYKKDEIQRPAPEPA